MPGSTRVKTPGSRELLRNVLVDFWVSHPESLGWLSAVTQGVWPPQGAGHDLCFAEVSFKSLPRLVMACPKDIPQLSSMCWFFCCCLAPFRHLAEGLMRPELWLFFCVDRRNDQLRVCRAEQSPSVTGRMFSASNDATLHKFSMRDKQRFGCGCLNCFPLIRGSESSSVWNFWLQGNWMNFRLSPFREIPLKSGVLFRSRGWVHRTRNVVLSHRHSLGWALTLGIPEEQRL